MNSRRSKGGLSSSTESRSCLSTVWLRSDSYFDSSVLSQSFAFAVPSVLEAFDNRS